MDLTKQEFLGMMLEQKGCKAIGLTTVTTDKDIYGREYVKTSQIAGLVGFIYQNSVNNSQEKAGQERNFEAKPRKWGKHINAQVIEHKGNHYLQIKVQAARKPFYLRDGVIYSRIEKKDRPTPDHGVIVRDYKFENITRVRYGGKSYRIVA